MKMQHKQSLVTWETKGELVRSLGTDMMFLYRNEDQVYSLWFDGYHVEFKNEVDALLFYIKNLEEELALTDNDFLEGAERITGGPMALGMPPLSKAQWAQSLLYYFEDFNKYRDKMAELWGYEREGPSPQIKAQMAYLRAILRKCG